MNNPVIHFEMPYKDVKRVNEFYSKVFGWDMHQLGEEMNNYILAGPTETVDMQSTKPGEINGGFFPVDEGGKSTLITIQVDDLGTAIENVKSSGGEVVEGPHDIPGIGKYASFIDTEGNWASMMQPNK